MMKDFYTVTITITVGVVSAGGSVGTLSGSTTTLATETTMRHVMGYDLFT